MRFWTGLIVTILFCSFFIVDLFCQGLFFDGITYATISRNLAFTGDILPLKYTDTIHSQFYEHPPLFFIFESFLFRLAGDYFFIEKLFSFLLLIGTLLTCYLLNKKIASVFRVESYFSIVMLLLFVTPIFTWSFRNNMIENLLVIFLLLSFYFILRSLFETKNNYLFSVCSALIIIAGIFTKGPVILGVFSVYIIFFFLKTFNVSRKNILMQFSAVVLIIATGIFLLTSNEEIRYNFNQYLELQVFRSLAGEREINVDNRFYILIRLLSELIPIFILVGFSFGYAYLKKVRLNKKVITISLVLILFGLCNSLPFMISPKQNGFYLVPSIPFFALAGGYSISDIFNKQLSIPIMRKLYWFNVAMVVAFLGVSFSRYGKIIRNENEIKAALFLKEKKPSPRIIASDNCESWALAAYLYRYSYVSLSCSINDSSAYFITYIPVSSDKDNLPLQKIYIAGNIGVYKKGY